jgi:hypothetical protein
MKTLLLATAALVLVASSANACIVANAFQSCPDGSLGRSAGGGWASPFPQSQNQSAFGTFNGQPFSSYSTPNGSMGTFNGHPFIINRY